MTIKHVLILIALAAGLSGKASAFSGAYDKAFSTATVVSVNCSSGTTPANVTQSLVGFNIASYRATVAGNQNPAGTVVYFGYNSNLSNATSPNIGVPVISSNSLTFQLGVNPDISNAKVSLYCLANSLATSGATVILELFGFK